MLGLIRTGLRPLAAVARQADQFLSATSIENARRAVIDNQHRSELQAAVRRASSAAKARARSA